MTPSIGMLFIPFSDTRWNASLVLKNSHVHQEDRTKWANITHNHYHSFSFLHFYTKGQSLKTIPLIQFCLKTARFLNLINVSSVKPSVCHLLAYQSKINTAGVLSKGKWQSQSLTNRFVCTDTLMRWLAEWHSASPEMAGQDGFRGTQSLGDST